jgi:Calx-beta domain
LISSFLLSGNIKKNSPLDSTEPWNNAGTPNADPGLSIADTRIVEGHSGQKSVEVMLSISPVSTNTVTVTYSTENGTASAGSDYVAANGTISFAKGELVKKIIVSVIGDLAVEADETFKIVLSNPSGARLSEGTGTVTIVNDDFPAGNLSIYEVRFSFTGYTTFYSSPPDCPIRSNGTVVLTGLLSGIEKVPADDDIYYTGTLQLDMDIDICSVNADTDPAQLCSITLLGSGPVKAELEIYFDQRGGYIKIKNESGRFMKNASGSCDREQIDEERTMIPDKTVASIFNGLELPMLTKRTLQVGPPYIEQNENTELRIEVLRKIR